MTSSTQQRVNTVLKNDLGLVWAMGIIEILKMQNHYFFLILKTTYPHQLEMIHLHFELLNLRQLTSAQLC